MPPYLCRCRVAADSGVIGAVGDEGQRVASHEMRGGGGQPKIGFPPQCELGVGLCNVLAGDQPKDLHRTSTHNGP